MSLFPFFEPKKKPAPLNRDGTACCNWNYIHAAANCCHLFHESNVEVKYLQHTTLSLTLWARMDFPLEASAVVFSQAKVELRPPHCRTRAHYHLSSITIRSFT